MSTRSHMQTTVDKLSALSRTCRRNWLQVVGRAHRLLAVISLLNVASGRDVQGGYPRLVLGFDRDPRDCVIWRHQSTMPHRWKVATADKSRINSCQAFVDHRSESILKRKSAKIHNFSLADLRELSSRVVHTLSTSGRITFTGFNLRADVSGTDVMPNLLLRIFSTLKFSGSVGIFLSSLSCPRGRTPIEPNRTPKGFFHSRGNYHTR